MTATDIQQIVKHQESQVKILARIDRELIAQSSRLDCMKTRYDNVGKLIKFVVTPLITIIGVLAGLKMLV
tara:strand:+ start:1420 stop:1629 length:210 start_codon:yes stop_codon:yes gene_type:complete